MITIVLSTFLHFFEKKNVLFVHQYMHVLVMLH